MHLESAETENIPPKPYIGRPPASDRSDEPLPAREGLPAAFKMRRERHYVEQLIGDAPLRTIREIPLSEIDAPGDEPVELDALQQSIREVGILQPLLVCDTGGAALRGTEGEDDHGRRFTIIAGANRYRAAVTLGLRTVPCVVCDTDSHTFDALREAAARRAIPVTRELSMPTLTNESPQSPAAEGLRDVTARLAFVSAVMPALDAAGYDPLRWNILTDLLKVEMERARSTAAAIEWLSEPDIRPTREFVDGASILDAVLEAVGPEARLQGVRVDVSSTLSGYTMAVDRPMIVRALIALVQSMLALSRPGTTLRIECTGTTVRPAMIVGVTQEECDVDESAAERFFDAAYVQHPNGVSGALMLAGVAHAARFHGGRVQARVHDGRGCAVTFVIPKPLAEA